VTITEITGWIPSTSSYREIHARTRTLDQMAFAEHRDMQITGTGEPVRVFAARVTASFFPLLGVNAAIGRTLLEEENQPGRTPAIVLSDTFWRAKMGGDPEIVGRTIRLDGRAALVVVCCRPIFISTIRRCVFRSQWRSTCRIQSIPREKSK
jgi:putative ABC transport system permease protein